MAILQALLALLSRSLGSIMSALFGWAVMALFGETSAREKAWLSALVGAAAASINFLIESGNITIRSTNQPDSP